MPKQLFNGERLSVIGERIKPYEDVIIFMITLLVANYFWKFTFVGDEDGEMVTWFGMDVTAPFEFMASHIARVVYTLVAFVRNTAYMVGDKVIRFESGSGSAVIWGCTGLKQSFIWFWLIATVLPQTTSNDVKPQTNLRNRLWLHKLWYIPLGWVCCYAFNILRIFLITLFVEFHSDWFPVLHDWIFKYAFYAMLFGLWVIFVEKIRPSVSSN